MHPPGPMWTPDRWRAVIAARPMSRPEWWRRCSGPTFPDWRLPDGLSFHRAGDLPHSGPIVLLSYWGREAFEPLRSRGTGRRKLGAEVGDVDGHAQALSHRGSAAWLQPRIRAAHPAASAARLSRQLRQLLR